MSEPRVPGDCGRVVGHAGAATAGTAMAGRGASTLQLHSRSCGLKLAGTPSSFGTHLCKSLTEWDAEISSVDAGRLCVESLRY